MILKTGLNNSGRFFQRKRYVFGWMNSSRLFPDTQQMFLQLWKRIGKLVFLFVQINFFRRKFFPEKIQFDNFLQNSVGVFLEFWGEKKFSGKLSAELSERDSTLSEGLFVFSFFSWHIYQKCVPVSRWKNSGIFENRKNVYEFFSELEQNFVLLWQQHFSRLSKMRFICLEQIFLGDFFTWKVVKQLDNLFQKLSILFVKFRNKITYYFWKVSALLPKLDCKKLDGFFR